MNTNSNSTVRRTGLNRLYASLEKAGVTISLPQGDKLIDVIAYCLNAANDKFIARPVKVIVNQSARFSVDQKYANIPELLLVYVWLGKNERETEYVALSFLDAVSILRMKGHTRTESWQKGYYTIPSIPDDTKKLIEPYLVTELNWNLVLFGGQK